MTAFECSFPPDWKISKERMAELSAECEREFARGPDGMVHYESDEERRYVSLQLTRLRMQRMEAEARAEFGAFKY